jgi:hypothetical protein
MRDALDEVRYRVDAATLLHEDFGRAAVGRGQARYAGFSDDPLDGFRDLATDLVRFGSVSSSLGWAWAHLRTRPAQNAAP